MIQYIASQYVALEPHVQMTSCSTDIEIYIGRQCLKLMVPGQVRDYITRKFSGQLDENFSFENWEERPRILDQEIGSRLSNFMKTASEIMRYSEISVGA